MESSSSLIMTEEEVSDTTKDSSKDHCSAYFEDFPIDDCWQTCPICKALGSARLKGCHPRMPLGLNSGRITRSRDLFCNEHGGKPCSSKNNIEDKDGSCLGDEEYNLFLPCITKIDIYQSIYQSVDKTAVTVLVNGYLGELLRLRTSGKKLDEDVQIYPLSRQFLLGVLVTLDVKGKVNEHSVLTDSHGTSYSVDLTSLDQKIFRVKGKTAVAVEYAGMRIATWQDKNFTFGNVDIRANESQCMVELEAAARNYQKQLLVPPKEMCAILSSGRHWILYTRVAKGRETMWRKTNTIDAFDDTQKDLVVLMILQFVSVIKKLTSQIDSVLMPQTVNHTADSGRLSGGGHKAPKIVTTVFTDDGENVIIDSPTPPRKTVTFPASVVSPELKDKAKRPSGTGDKGRGAVTAEGGAGGGCIQNLYSSLKSL